VLMGIIPCRTSK